MLLQQLVGVVEADGQGKVTLNGAILKRRKQGEIITPLKRHPRNEDTSVLLRTL